MASMSYCMFENTETELQQVVRAMKEVDSWSDLDMNSHESNASSGLFDLCQAYIKHFHRLATDEDLDLD